MLSYSGYRMVILDSTMTFKVTLNIRIGTPTFDSKNGKSKKLILHLDMILSNLNSLTSLQVFQQYNNAVLVVDLVQSHTV